MHRRSKMRDFSHISCGVAVTVLTFFLLGSSGTAQKEEDKCCYTNSRGYRGICVVTPGEGETCASILAYLNNAQSIGKTYCGNTKVRGGWKQVSCEKEGANTFSTEKTCRMPQDPPS
jgi:hypothetical protein